MNDENNLYFIELSEEGPIIYLETGDITLEAAEKTVYFANPEVAIEHFKTTTLCLIAHYRAKADYLMDNLKSIQPMEDLK